ncbi:MAG TPA: GNAT family N-acetyltransferase [Intrasporangium sp.]|nr:GNAT family N-acetyltransferase [Intrasporangium sp.]
MSRSPVHVRGVAPDDAVELLEVWQLPQRAHGTRDGALADIQAAIRKVLADDRERIMLAVTGSRIVGAVHLQIAPLAPLAADLGLHVSHLHVHADFRRRGIARCLMEAAVTWAEENGIVHVVGMGPVNSRESSRFMARLGFTQAVVLRVAPTAALRARLPMDPIGGRTHGGGRQLAQVLAQRRSQRRKQGIG